MEAPASVDLVTETHEKAADAHTTASSIWYIFRLPLAKIPGCTLYRATNVIRQQTTIILYRPSDELRHAATKIAEGAPIARIRSQAMRTTVILEYLKFTNENKF
jgi:hypothetical protein